MFNRLAWLVARDYELTLKGLMRRKHPFRDTEEAFTTEVFGFRLYPHFLAGLMQANRIRQSQAWASATIWLNAGHDFRQKHNVKTTWSQNTSKLPLAVKFSAWDEVNLTRFSSWASLSVLDRIAILASTACSNLDAMFLSRA